MLLVARPGAPSSKETKCAKDPQLCGASCTDPAFVHDEAKRAGRSRPEPSTTPSCSGHEGSLRIEVVFEVSFYIPTLGHMCKSHPNSKQLWPRRATSFAFATAPSGSCRHRTIISTDTPRSRCRWRWSRRGGAGGLWRRDWMAVVALGESERTSCAHVGPEALRSNESPKTQRAFVRRLGLQPT